ncbi:hypothetical protein VP501E541_P0197 [Vibrio phage 501E54-1]|nr:hypothetical protein VP501E541_P0197 [Vibrio phage 501E54-1]
MGEDNQEVQSAVEGSKVKGLNTEVTDNLELFSKHFTMKERNGIIMITHNETGKVVKRAKSTTAIHEWVTRAIVVLKEHYV